MKNLRNEIEESQMEADRLTSLSNAIEDAWIEGHNSADTYEGAMYILSDLLGEHTKKLRKLWEQIPASAQRKDVPGATNTKDDETSRKG